LFTGDQLETDNSTNGQLHPPKLLTDILTFKGFNGH